MPYVLVPVVRTIQSEAAILATALTNVGAGRLMRVASTVNVTTTSARSCCSYY